MSGNVELLVKCTRDRHLLSLLHSLYDTMCEGS